MNCKNGNAEKTKLINYLENKGIIQRNGSRFKLFKVSKKLNKMNRHRL